MSGNTIVFLANFCFWIDVAGLLISTIFKEGQLKEPEGTRHEPLGVMCFFLENPLCGNGYCWTDAILCYFSYLLFSCWERPIKIQSVFLVVNQQPALYMDLLIMAPNHDNDLPNWNMEGIKIFAYLKWNFFKGVCKSNYNSKIWIWWNDWDRSIDDQNKIPIRNIVCFLYVFVKLNFE